MNDRVTSLSPTDVGAAEEMLRKVPVAYLAMIEPDGPYAVPVNFAYVAPEDAAGLEGRIVFHTGEGRKTDALATDPRVCLVFTAGVAFVQGDAPCADGFSFRSLLVWGRARRIEDPGRREDALRWIVAKYDPGAVEDSFDEADFALTLVYEVAIEAASFKQRPTPTAG